VTPGETTPNAAADDVATTKDSDVVPDRTDVVLDKTDSDATASASAEADTDTVVASETETEAVAAEEPVKAGINWPRVFAFMVLPALALILGAAAGFLKWQDSTNRDDRTIAAESIAVAKDATVRLLSYKPDSVEQDLGSARDLLTGEFQESYTQLINDVVIPGSQEKQISAVATVPAAASVSAEPNKAVVLVFVNQTVLVGADAPTATTSSVQVTMERVGDRWLISEFNPV
jgi:Mce-associated membrane protein